MSCLAGKRGCGGNPAAPLVRLLTESVRGDAARLRPLGCDKPGRDRHGGMLVHARRSPSSAGADGVAAACAAGRAHGTTVCRAVRAQQALPITFGLKAADGSRGDDVGRRLAAVPLAVQVGGAPARSPRWAKKECASSACWPRSSGSMRPVASVAYGAPARCGARRRAGAGRRRARGRSRSTWRCSRQTEVGRCGARRRTPGRLVHASAQAPIRSARHWLIACARRDAASHRCLRARWPRSTSALSGLAGGMGGAQPGARL